MVERRFGVRYRERGMGKLVRALGFSRISARPQHPKSDPEAQAEFKKTCRPDRRCRWRPSARQTARALVPDAMRRGRADTGGPSDTDGAADVDDPSRSGTVRNLVREALLLHDGEALAEHDGELRFRLEPFPRRAFPVVAGAVQHEV